jgi:hypothetical protein
VNRHARRKAKVSEVKAIPIADISGFMCAWDGCAATFTGDMPRGWIYLLTYWSPRPELTFWTIPSHDILRDAVLCPEHTRAPESQLKDLFRLGWMSRMGVARSTQWLSCTALKALPRSL